MFHTGILLYSVHNYIFASSLSVWSEVLILLVVICRELKIGDTAFAYISSLEIELFALKNSENITKCVILCFI